MNRSVCLTRLVVTGRLSVRKLTSSVGDETVEDDYSYALKRIQDLPRLWSFIGQNHHNLNVFQAMTSMKTIHKFLSPSGSTLRVIPRTSAHELWKTDQFNALCNRISQLIDSMSPSQLLSLLDLFIDFSVPPDSEIFGKLLKTINMGLYDFSTDEVSQVYLSLKHLQHSLYLPNSEIDFMLTAIPILLEKKIDSPETDLTMLTRIFCSFSLEEHLKFKILDVFKSIHSRRSELNDSQCIDTLAGMVTLREELFIFDRQMASQLIDHCFHKLSHTELDFPEELFVKFFILLARKAKPPLPQKWLDKASQIFTKRVPFEPLTNISIVIDTFSMHNHLDFELFDLYAKRAMATSQDIHSLNMNDLSFRSGILLRIASLKPEIDDEEKKVSLQHLRAVYDRRTDWQTPQYYFRNLVKIAQARDRMIEMDLEGTTKLTEYLLEMFSRKIECPNSLFQYIFLKLYSKLDLKYRPELCEHFVKIVKDSLQTGDIQFYQTEQSILTLRKCGHVDLSLIRMYDELVHQLKFGYWEEGKPSWDKYLNIVTTVPQYQPVAGWDAMIDHLNENFVADREKVRGSNLINAIYNLITVGKYVEALHSELNRRLQASTCEFLSELSPAVLLNLLYVNVGLSQSSTLPPECVQLKKTLSTLVETVVKTVVSSSEGLSESAEVLSPLAECLGGNDYLCPLIWNEQGLPIANFVAFDAARQPVKMSWPGPPEEPKFLSSIPQNSLMVSFMPLTALDVTKQGMVKRSCNFRLKSLKKSHIRAVTFDMNLVNSLTESERKAFLVTLIKEKLEELIEGQK